MTACSKGMVGKRLFPRCKCSHIGHINSCYCGSKTSSVLCSPLTSIYHVPENINTPPSSSSPLLPLLPALPPCFSIALFFFLLKSHSANTTFGPVETLSSQAPVKCPKSKNTTFIGATFLTELLTLLLTPPQLLSRPPQI